jgi:hypothetical protein
MVKISLKLNHLYRQRSRPADYSFQNEPTVFSSATHQKAFRSVFLAALAEKRKISCGAPCCFFDKGAHSAAKTPYP